MSDIFNIFDKFNKKEILNNEKELQKLETVVENLKKTQEKFKKNLENNTDYEKILLDMTFGEVYKSRIKDAQSKLDQALEKVTSQKEKKALDKLFGTEIKEAQELQQKINNEIQYLKDNSLQTIFLIKKEKEALLKKLDNILEKISSLRSKIDSAYRFYNSKASSQRKSYGVTNLASKRTTLSEVWDALDEYNQIKEDIEPQIEKEINKKEKLNFKIEEINEVITKLEDEYIANKIKPNLISSEINNIKHPESELTNQIYIKNAKEKGYVPASEFISLVRTVEGEISLNKFLVLEPTVLNTNKEELFVVLTKGTFSYSPQTDEFIFKKEIEYEKLEKVFESKSVYKLKSQLNEPRKLVRDVYDSGEVAERLKMYENSNTLTDQIEIQKWESIKNSYETGFYETDSEKDKRIKLEIEEVERKKLEAQFLAERKQKSIKFIKNNLHIYKKFYSRVNEETLDSFFYEDKKNQIIAGRWIDEKVEFKKSKNGKLFAIKPCIAGCVSSKEEYKFVYRKPPSSSNFRVYECEASQRSDFKGWHLTSKDIDGDVY